jgi:AbiV family abortive infection protein
MKGRRLYLELADQSLVNSGEYLVDARILKSRGSRGHAVALSILSIEESAKAYLYKLAGEGVFRIVKRNPNGISTFSETQLLDHKFKHATIAKLLWQGLWYAPVTRVMAKTRRATFSRGQVERMLGDLLHEQELVNIELSTPGRKSSAIRKLFTILETANRSKNSGLYVGHHEGKVSRPSDFTRRRVSEWLDLAELTNVAAREIVHTAFGESIRVQSARSIRETASAVKLASKRASRGTKIPPSG